MQTHLSSRVPINIPAARRRTRRSYCTYTRRRARILGRRLIRYRILSHAHNRVCVQVQLRMVSSGASTDRGLGGYASCPAAVLDARNSSKSYLPFVAYMKFLFCSYNVCVAQR